MKASVPKLFFCPGSASYTPVTQGSRWRVASRQLRKPTTPSALAFFVVDRAPSGFPFGCAVQNPITPFAQTLPTRPLFPQNTAPQTLSPTALTHCSHAPKHSSLAAGLSQFRGGTRQSRGEHKRILAAEKTNSEPARRALPARKGRKGGEKGAGFRLASTQKSCWASAEQGKAEASRADPGGQNQKPEGRNQEAGKFWVAENRCKLQKLGIYGKLAQNATKMPPTAGQAGRAAGLPESRNCSSRRPLECRDQPHQEPAATALVIN